MLIFELENWMPTDEANANMERKIIERIRKQRQAPPTPPDKGEVRNETGKGNANGSKAENTACSHNQWNTVLACVRRNLQFRST